nr:cysteine peptidase family C39 domain-containing protein [Tenacibaculum maritimum]
MDNRDCGPTCLRMVARFQRKNFSSEFLRDRFGIIMHGVTMSGIADATDATEMRTLGMHIF